MRSIPLLLLLSSLGAWLAPVRSAAEDRPNIILIYTDDHGWPDIGPAGIYEDLKTPHLDALAASGIHATNGYSTAPQCIPSRAGLLIGKYQNRFGVESNAETLEGFDAELTVAERLKKVGYTTAQIGKWHLGPGNAIDQHGFDYFYNKNRNAPCHANFDQDGKLTKPFLRPHTKYHLDDCSDAALTFIRQAKDKPFFLYLAYRAPHVPLDAPKEHLDRFPGEMPERRRQALAMIASMDDGVGAITAELKKLNLTEKTLIFYIGDNGAPLKIHKLDAPGGGPGWDGSLNKPMNGEKGMLAEGGIRVPFLITWPGTLPAGKTYDHPLIALDATATALELAGVHEDALDGTNIIPHLQKNTAPERALFWRWIAQAAIREGNWKLLVGGTRQYLFNLDQDPGELNNLLKAHPEKAKELHEKLNTWSRELLPAGLATKAMAETWERYFDFYLDGKPAPKLRNKVQPDPQPDAWISRNSTLKTKEGALHISPNKNANQAPFLVKNHLTLHNSFTARIKIRSKESGKVGIAWRMDGQKDFNSDQIVMTAITGSPDWQIVSLQVPARGNTIHLRLHLPKAETAIGHITLKDTRTNRTWHPGKP